MSLFGNKSTNSGFTLIEVLIVVGITSLLAGMILTYTSSSRDQVALYVEEAKLAQIISRSKSLTIATYNDPEVPCGYGVAVDYYNHTYRLFAYSAANCSDISTLDPENKTVVEEIKLPSNIRFKAPDEDSVEDILFLPPDPKVWIWHAEELATSTFGDIVLITPGGVEATVKVGMGGQITF